MVAAGMAEFLRRWVMPSLRWGGVRSRRICPDTD
jgi:hypothetical protein